MLALFVDDGSLAVAILALLAAVALVTTMAASAQVKMALLVGGTLVLLLENVMRASARATRR